MTQSNGQEIGTALQAGFYKGLAQTPTSVIEVPGDRISVDMPWYQPAIEHPFAALIVVTAVFTAAVHFVTLIACRRAKVSPRLPLTVFWVVFLASALPAFLRVFPFIAVPVLVGGVVFLIMMLTGGEAAPHSAAAPKPTASHNPFLR